MRKCSNCGYRIDDDNLVLCPNCKNSPTPETADIPPDVYKRLRRDVIKSLVLWIFGPFTLVGCIGYVLLITSGIKEAHRQIRNKVTDEFKEPRIREIVTSVAVNEAKQILEQQVKPALDQLKISTAKIEEAKNFAEEFRSQYEAKLLAVEQQLNLLGEYNAIASLAAQAISNADRKSFDKLKATWKDATSDEIKRASVASILTVKSFYITATRTEGYRLRDYSGALDLPASIPKPNEEFSTTELIQFLKTATDWRARAVSAALLGSKRTKAVPAALLQAAEKDSNLEVVRNAKRAFKQVTGFTDGDILDTDEMSGWWTLSSQDILEKLSPDTP